MLDLLCFSGEVAWARLSGRSGSGRAGADRPRPIRSTPVALFLREHRPAWHALSVASTRDDLPREAPSPNAAILLALLEQRGALFLHEIASAICRRDVQQAWRSSWLGHVTPDGSAPRPRSPRREEAPRVAPSRAQGSIARVARAGRWSAVPVSRPMPSIETTRLKSWRASCSAVWQVFAGAVAREPHVATGAS